MQCDYALEELAAIAIVLGNTTLKEHISAVEELLLQADTRTSEAWKDVLQLHIDTYHTKKASKSYAEHNLKFAASATPAERQAQRQFCAYALHEMMKMVPDPTKPGQECGLVPLVDNLPEVWRWFAMLITFLDTPSLDISQPASTCSFLVSCLKRSA